MPTQTLTPDAPSTRAHVFAAGDDVVIEKVAFPHLPHHAKFLGQRGKIERIYKVRPTANVRLPDGRVRECNITFLTAAPQ